MTSSIIQTAVCITACGALALAPPVLAQKYPERPVRVVVPFPPGGGVDTVTRMLAQKLGEQTGSQFIVENRPGAAATIGTEAVARAAPDGYTLVTSATEFVTNPVVRPQLPYDPFRDFVHITQLAAGQYLLAVHPSVPAHTVRELIALAKMSPGKLNYGSSGTGGVLHLATLLFESQAGIRCVHVPFKGTGPAMVGLLSGEIDMMIAGTIPMSPQVRAGRVRPVAVTGARRFPGLPAVPTIAEAGLAGYSVTGWYGFYAPAGTPPAIVSRLHAETKRALNTPAVVDRLAQLGNEPVASEPAAFTAFLRSEYERWSAVVKAAGLSVK